MSEVCFICGEDFKPGDMVLPDMDGGIGHVTCFGPDREGYVKNINTGEPLGPRDPIPTGRPWEEHTS